MKIERSNHLMKGREVQANFSQNYEKFSRDREKFIALSTWSLFSERVEGPHNYVVGPTIGGEEQRGNEKYLELQGENSIVHHTLVNVLSYRYLFRHFNQSEKNDFFYYFLFYTTP